MNNKKAGMTGKRKMLDRKRKFKEELVTLKRYTIFIVNSNADTLLCLASCFKETCNVISVKCGKDAITRIRRIPKPDIILLDVMIGDMDSYELLWRITGSDKFRDIPVVLLSENGSVQDRIKGLSAGAVDYITKPFVLAEVKVKIMSLIRFREICFDSHYRQIELEIINSLENMNKEKKENKIHQSPQNIYAKYGVTIRERKIIELLLEGLLNKEIGDRLHISRRTVEFHIHNIYNKFHVKNRMELFTLIKSEA